MVAITDINGNNLTELPPADALATAGATGFFCRLQAKIVELNPMLPQQNLSGTLNWNDGSQPVVLSGQGLISVDQSHVLGPGSFLISLLGHNYELPAPSQVRINYFIRVLPALQIAPAPNIIYGPILPRDQGFPGVNDWLLDTGNDLGILESSLKMLLTTAKGERIMEPEYGTNLRRLIFETNSSNIEATVNQEIIEATTQWEPRVDLQSAQVVRGGADNREVSIFCIFVSKLGGQGFQISLQFTQ